ncbi:MAG: helix-turn-helix transcriptional regulator [Bacilli bacterium]|nr:helix-turn-helix transcriptional regulator [Bacilli bacterium]
MKKGIKLVLKEGTTFDLYFLDGVVKRYDIISLADKFPQLNALKDRTLFSQGKLLGWGGVIWNDELDVSSETIYEDGVDVSSEYDDIDTVVLGYKIKQKRIELKMSQEELAEKIGIDQSDLSKIEKGSANPSIKMLSRIANGLKSKASITIE